MTFAVARRRHRPWRSSANRAETWLRFWTGAGSINPRREGFRCRESGRRPGPFRGRAQGRAQGRRNLTRTWGGVSGKQWGGVSGPTLPFFAGFVRAFGAKPDSPSRASGEGLDGSDPPFLTAGAVSRGGGCQARCQAPCQTPTPSLWGSLPSVFIPAGRLPRPLAAGTTPNGAPVRLTSKPRPAVGLFCLKS